MNKPTTDSAELLRRIDRFCFDADYTIDELKDEMREEGIDPDELLRDVKERTKHLINWKEQPAENPPSVEVMG
jgi:hypothetical protein